MTELIIVVRPVQVTEYAVICSECGQLDQYRTAVEAQSWAEHHSRAFHND